MMGRRLDENISDKEQSGVERTRYGTDLNGTELIRNRFDLTRNGFELNCIDLRWNGHDNIRN